MPKLSKKQADSVRVSVRIPQELDKLIKSTDETTSTLVKQALDAYFTSSVSDTELVKTSLLHLTRDVELLSATLNRFINLWYFSLTSIFAGIPDISSKTPQEQKEITETANRRKQAMLAAYKQMMLRQPSIMEALVFDYVEEKGKSHS